MTQTSGFILCLAYILGLLSTAVPWGGYGVLALGIGAAIIIPFGIQKSKLNSSFWRVEAKPRLWLAVGLIGFLASLYFQAQIPQPAGNDISKFVPSVDVSNQEQIVTVQGKVASTPRLTRNQRGQFWLKATQLDEENNLSRDVTGKLYVTVPLLQVTGLHEGQAIAVTGNLYKPKAAANPGSFDFKAYLEREGTFAGLKGRQVNFLDERQASEWGWWKLRERIVRSQVRWLGSPKGPLVSSMVLGSKAVDLPYDIRDLFIQTGLAHALAASGFQISLILGLILGATKRFSERSQLISGMVALGIFLGLTGFQPSVLRAVIMGFAALIALATQRKVKPLGSILVAATLLLLFNPLWIWDLGFQLSFLATLGLIVTVPPLVKWLDWMPPVIAALIAVPIAASLWTLPLLLHVFSVVPVYSIVVNIISIPLISIISIGGMIAALAALILPVAGSALAWLLYYPTHLLIGLVEFFCQLPGNSVAVGTISVLQLLAIYGLIGLAWLLPWWQRRWWLAGLIAIALLLVPGWLSSATVFRVTVLAGTVEPVLVIQEQGKVLLVNSGNVNNARFTVLPFLQQQGVNKIDLVIATNSQFDNSSGWLEILNRIPVKTFYHLPLEDNKTSNLAIIKALQVRRGRYQPLSVGQTVADGSIKVQLIDDQIPMLHLQIQGQSWLILENINLKEQKKLTLTGSLPRVQVLWWSGKSLNTDLLKLVRPEVAIASSASLAPDTMFRLREGKTKLFWTGRDGAIQWTPNRKFEATVETMENNAFLL